MIIRGMINRKRIRIGLPLNLQLRQIPVFILDDNSRGHQTPTDRLCECKCDANSSTQHPPPPSNYIDPLDVLLDGCIGVRDLRCESYNTGGERIEGEIRDVWVRGATLGGRTE